MVPYLLFSLLYGRMDLKIVPYILYCSSCFAIVQVFISESQELDFMAWSQCHANLLAPQITLYYFETSRLPTRKWPTHVDSGFCHNANIHCLGYYFLK